jgi:hypothetical protein
MFIPHLLKYNFVPLDFIIGKNYLLYLLADKDIKIFKAYVC